MVERCSCSALVSLLHCEFSNILLTWDVVDAYRNKMRSTMVANGQDVTTVAPHFETRPGKRKWQDRGKRMRHAESP